MGGRRGTAEAGGGASCRASGGLGDTPGVARRRSAVELIEERGCRGEVWPWRSGCRQGRGGRGGVAVQARGRRRRSC